MSPDRAFEAAVRRAVAALRIPLEDHPEPLSITVSVGVASHKSPDDGDLNLIARADLALYEAKRAGRNRVVGERVG